MELWVSVAQIATGVASVFGVAFIGWQILAIRNNSVIAELEFEKEMCRRNEKIFEIEIEFSKKNKLLNKKEIVELERVRENYYLSYYNLIETFCCNILSGKLSRKGHRSMYWEFLFGIVEEEMYKKLGKDEKGNPLFNNIEELSSDWKKAKKEMMKKF